MFKTARKVPISLIFAQREGKVLIFQKISSVPEWNMKWEFPGGKIETGETPLDAILREFGEETRLPLSGVKFLGEHHHVWDLEEEVIQVHFYCFKGSAGKGNPITEPDKVHKYCFVAPNEIDQFDLLEPDRPLFYNLYMKSK